MELNKIQVLLIDDDEDDFVNIKGVLGEIQGSKYGLTWKSNYPDGRSALNERRFDVCLLDYRLGERTGLELLQEMQEEGGVTPIIFLTGQGDFDLDVRAMHSGAADYLVKSQITAPLLERSLRYAMKHALDMREVAEQNENFRVLFNSTFEGIVVHKNGSIVDANVAAGETFGLDVQALIGRDLADFVRPDFHANLKKSFQAKDNRPIEIAGRRGNGTEFSLEIANRVIVLKGHPISLAAIRDLTQRKQMEAQILQQDRLASLGLLASSLAHEIGTPLGIIRGRAEMIGKTIDPKIRSTMELITQQIDRIGKLVNSLLHIARGGHSDQVTDVNVAQVIDDVANLMSHEMQRKGIELKLAIPRELFVRSESGPLGQVILNLMVNSVHAIEEAQKRGRSENHQIAITAEEGENEAVLWIRDTGCGISAQHLNEIFKPFFTTKDIGLGTGLGLATSFKLVQSWGGSIAVESRVDEGATFKIALKRGHA